jgi:hypothetical protein
MIITANDSECIAYFEVCLINHLCQSCVQAFFSSNYCWQPVLSPCPRHPALAVSEGQRHTEKQISPDLKNGKKIKL